MKRSLLVLGILFVLPICFGVVADVAGPTLDLSSIESGVSPGDDFYQYANGGWLARNPIPPEFSNWGGFIELAERNRAILHEILEKAAQTDSLAKTEPGCIRPNRNEVVFPAGILQPPFFFQDADDAVNYGGIGAVIGHEMTHGFDDRGRHFDARGNLRDWWTAEDAKRFLERGKRIVSQFDSYIAIDSLHVNGRLTEGENIADLGGVKIALSALESALSRQTAAEREKKIDDLTQEQRFFYRMPRFGDQTFDPSICVLSSTLIRIARLHSALTAH